MKRLIPLLILLIPLVAFDSSAWFNHSSGKKRQVAETPTIPEVTSGNQASNDADWSTTVTASFTPSSPGSTSIVIAVGYANQIGVNISGMTYDGNAMTIIGSQVDNGSDNKHAAMYYYAGALGSGAKNVVMTTDASADLNLTVIQIDGADTGTPVHVNDSGVGAAGSPSTVTVSTTTTNTNCLIICGVATSTSATGTHSVCSATGQTYLNENEGSASVVTFSHYDKAAAGAVSQCHEFSVDYKAVLSVIAAINADGV